MTTPICPKCHIESRLTTGKEIYPHRPDLHSRYYYKCDRCGGYVGCHGTTSNPLGTPADAHLRHARHVIHSIIDPLWKSQTPKKKARGKVYGYLSRKLEIPLSETHVGMFDIERCRQAYRLMKSVSFADIQQEFSSDNGASQ